MCFKTHMFFPFNRYCDEKVKNRLKQWYWRVSFLDMISQEVISNICMLCPGVLNWIFELIYGTCVVTIDKNIFKFSHNYVESVLFIEVVHNNFCNDMFCLCHDQGNQILYFCCCKILDNFLKSNKCDLCFFIQ